MPVTLLEVRTQVRSALNERAPGSWQDYELDLWINEGARDIARRAETIQHFHDAIPVLSNFGKYALPSDLIRLHRVQFNPVGTQQTYTIEKSNYAEMDQYWGSDQTTPSTYPSKYVVWGTPPRLQIQVYPVPSQAGMLHLYYYRNPVKAIRDQDIVEVPEGWHDCIALYAEFQAKRRDKDVTWEVAKKLYEDVLNDLVAVSRDWTDQSSQMIGGDSGYWFEDA